MKTVIICCLAMLATLIGLIVYKDFHWDKDYAYRPAEHDCGFGIVRATLSGNWTIRGRDQVRGSPYMLFISFRRPGGEGTVTLKKAELRDADHRERVCAKMEESTNHFKPYWQGGYAAYFNLEDLNLEYVPYIVSIELVVNQGQKTESKDVELFLAQDYQQRWGLQFWDVIMGI